MDFLRGNCSLYLQGLQPMISCGLDDGHVGTGFGMARLDNPFVGALFLAVMWSFQQQGPADGPA